MLRFFRRIRGRFINEGNLKRYLLYAIGEILLVMIGILLALQVNNWNERQKNNQEEAIYKRNLVVDLRDQLQAISLQEAHGERMSEAVAKLIQNYNENLGFQVDSTLFRNLGIITNRKTFHEIKPTYTALISSGKIDLFAKKEIQNSIIKYYQELDRVSSIFKQNNAFHLDLGLSPKVLELASAQRSQSKDILEKQLDEKGEFSQANFQILEIKNKKILNTVEQVLSNPEKELQLINQVDLRQQMVIIHLAIIEEIEEKTIALIKLLDE